MSKLKKKNSFFKMVKYVGFPFGNDFKFTIYSTCVYNAPYDIIN